MICHIDRCEGKAVSGGFCSKHRQRKEKHGNPFVVKKSNGDAYFEMIKNAGHLELVPARRQGRGWAEKEPMRKAKPTLKVVG